MQGASVPFMGTDILEDGELALFFHNENTTFTLTSDALWLLDLPLLDWASSQRFVQDAPQQRRTAPYSERASWSQWPAVKLLPLLLLLCGCIYKPVGDTCHCAPMGFTVPHGPNGRLGTETYYPLPNPF